MKKLKYVILLLGGLFVLGSCSKRLSPFTQQLYDSNNWTEDELKQVQFYLSDDVVLRREANSGNSRIEGGEIKVIDGRKVEEIVIRKNTPGILVFIPKEKRFAVSFETNDDRFLMFGPNPKAGNRYILLASEWKRSRGTVTYDGKPFYTPSSSAYAALLVDLKKVRKVSVKSRTAKGRKVN